MTADPVAARYAQALFEQAKAEGRRDETLAELALIGGLLREHPDLRQFMGNPDVEIEDKVALLDRSLKGSWSALGRAFVQMAVALGRVEHLAEIADALQAAVDADEGRVRAVVRSAHRLSASALKRLRAALERRERRQVELREELDPKLLGGLQVRLDHRVIDGSVRRQLADLRERLSAVRV